MIISGLKNDFVRINRYDSIDPLLGLSEAISAIFSVHRTASFSQSCLQVTSVCELPAYACASMHDNDKLRHI